MARNENGHRFQGNMKMPKKFDKCVKAVKAKGKATNAYAVCNAAMHKKGMKK